MYTGGGPKTHKYEDPICISLPTFNYLRVLLLGLINVHGPDPVRRVSVVLVWFINEITVQLVKRESQHTVLNL